ncbi:hypothetical protein M1D48_13975 [Erwinia sp. D4-22]
MDIYKKGFVLIKSLLLTVYFTLKAIFSRNNLKDGHSELIVSITSYGKRLNYVFLTIETILNQNYKPSMIILWLYKNDVPSGWHKKILDRQIKRGLVVKYVDIDVKSFKKLSFILDKNYISLKESVKYIVTADDDIFYPANWLTGFKINYSSNKSEKAILCYRGRNMVVQGDGCMAPYDQWSLATKASSHCYSILPTGVSGICYPIESLDSTIQNFSDITERCPYADDIWYKMVTLNNGYEARLILDESIHFIPVFTGFTKGLEKTNVLNKRNDAQFKSAMDYFNLSARKFKNKEM